uniref:Mp21-like protein n=1 Tax=Heterostelium pallidum TaxID=13642 RepID=B2XX42_HETPA|nr:Mp21-like protein [Heterostelium pallidum]
MEIKDYKYNQSILKYNQLFKKNVDNEAIGFILLQSNGIAGKQLNKLKQVMLYNNIEIIYLNNILKKKVIKDGLYNENIINNDLLLVKCSNIFEHLNFFFKYVTEEKLEDTLICLNFILNYKSKYKNKSIYFYNKYLKKASYKNKEDVSILLFKTIKLKLITILLKLRQILNANIQSIKKTKN